MLITGSPVYLNEKVSKQKKKSGGFFSCCQVEDDGDTETNIFEQKALTPIQKRNHGSTQRFSDEFDQTKDYTDYKIPNETFLSNDFSQIGLVSPKHSTMWELAQSVNMKSFRSIGLNKDQYKWILLKYDMQRDTRLSNLNQKYWDSNNGICAPADRITKEQYKEQRVRIEWDIAWSIFDHVN